MSDITQALAWTLRNMPWTAVTPAQKRRARAMEKRGEVSITEVASNYVGRHGLVVNRDLYVEPITKQG